MDTPIPEALAKKGESYQRVEDKRLILGYRRERFVRETWISASAPATIDKRGLIFAVNLEPHSRWTTCLDVVAEMLGKFDEGDESDIQTLWQGLRDSDGYVCIACAKALVQIGQRFSTKASIIESKLVQAIADPAFESIDTPEMVDDNYVTRCPAYDYAYDALWLLIANRRSSEE